MQERNSGANKKDQSIKPLTARQSEVLNLIGKGFTNKEIAKTLGISHFTLKHFTTEEESGIYAKLGTTSKLETVIKAIDEGLLDSEEISTRFDFDKLDSLSLGETRVLFEISKPQNYYLGYKGLAPNMSLKINSLRSVSSIVFKKLGIRNREDAVMFTLLRPGE